MDFLEAYIEITGLEDNAIRVPPRTPFLFASCCLFWLTCVSSVRPYFVFYGRGFHGFSAQQTSNLRLKYVFRFQSSTRISRLIIQNIF